MSTDDAAVERLSADYSARARVYHRAWAPVLASMAMPLLKRLPLAQATRVLDVGTGSGILAPALRAAAPHAWLLGIDRAEGMLQLARRELTCASMDAQRLALRARSFDVVLLAYVLFHCPDPVVALGEVRRVLRGSGTIGVVHWGANAAMPGTAIWAEELDALGAAPATYDARVDQRALMNTPDKLVALLDEARFDTARAQCDEFEFRWSIRRLLTIHANCGPASRRLETLTPALRTECRRRVARRLAQLNDAQRVCRLQVVSAVAHTS
ncbi:MAG TPA: class I SAM-dependent methyltransferase [Burkholderiaceae bacterium]|nr:class I SAM-dependent methyltransferase [Burkholderiaceae bacterium]